ncbi:MAG: maltose alpha-D-glucosyltransferase [Desulfobacterales bacterium]
MTEKGRKKQSIKRTPLWYKDVVIYQLHVKTFYDADGDGIGDFKGLRKKLAYLEELGVTALWLLPFYPSPLRDDGYDISDFKEINPSHGTLRDFKAFLREAHQRGLKVITELVINHTSDQHPWFQQARKAKPGSAKRNFYVWSDTPEKYKETRIIFQDFETSNWTWDPVAKAYYWHRFYSHQPDLNFENPHVREAIFKTLDFWLDMGVDGMRLDAVPYLYEREGTNCENLPETHAFLKELRSHLDKKYDDRMLLAEANQWPEDAVQYFGDGDECHMNFHFPLMPRLYMSLHMENRFPVVDILQQTPEIPESNQWAIFLRNHDELTLEMVTDEERDYMYNVYAQDPRMRINLGIRRRLAPLLGNHRRRIELMNGLLMSLPGTPVIYYGDEIGMGDNIFLGDRNGVRTPMQWSPDRNAGFSRSNPHKLYLPVIIDPEYHFEVVNVESQKNNRHSLLWWMRRLIALRNQIKAFSRGNLTFLDPENTKILAFIRGHQEQRILVVANFSRYVQYVELDLSDHLGSIPFEIFGNTPFPRITGEPYFLTLGPHSFYWFNLQPQETLETAAEPVSEPERTPILQVETLWEELFKGPIPGDLEKGLAPFLTAQRWFGSKNRLIKKIAITEILPLRETKNVFFILFAKMSFMDGADETYVIPVTVIAGEEAENVLKNHPRTVIARVRVRSGDSLEYLIDASIQKEFCLSLLDKIARRAGIKGQKGRLTAWPEKSLKLLHKKEEPPFEFKVITAEQSNTSVVFGDRFILKLFRRLQKGVNPDLEIGRFLTRKGFGHIPLSAGAMEYVENKEEPKTLAFLQEFVPNQGDAWKYTLNSLQDYFQHATENGFDKTVKPPGRHPLRLAESEIPDEVTRWIGVYLSSVNLMARRTAEMHVFLASEKEDPAFFPEEFSKLYQRSLYQSMRSLAGQVLPQLQKRAELLSKSASIEANRILDNQKEIMNCFHALIERKITGKRLRCHGDFHLGQVLYTGKDFVIIDFEGEPLRPIGERKIKRSPLSDVAGMLRSFHYAAYCAVAEEETRGLAHSQTRESLEKLVEYWCSWVCAAFLRRYLIEARPGDFLPRTDDEIQILMDSLLMEKAVYELGYEINNRPDWIRIPLKGIEELLKKADKAKD